MAASDAPLPPPDPTPVQASPAAPAKVSRRRFLGRLALGGAVALGGLTLHQCTGYGTPPFTPQAVSDKEAAVLLAAAARILDGLPPDVIQQAAAWVDGYLARQSAPLRREVRALLHLVEHAPPLLSGRFSRFTRLDAAGQDAYLSAFAASQRALLRQGWSGLKSLLLMGAWGQPATWELIGYGGPLPRPEAPR